MNEKELADEVRTTVEKLNGLFVKVRCAGLECDPYVREREGTEGTEYTLEVKISKPI